MPTSSVRLATGRSAAALEATPMSSVSLASGHAAPLAHMSSGSPASAAAPGLSAAPSTLPSSDSNPQDATSGPLRDGRVRNPVPSKLKGKTDGSKGNFGVMQIEVAGRTEATRSDRDAEAKRTSESTEMAAKRAFENGYVSLRRSRFVHLPDEPVAKPFVPTTPSAPTPVQTQRRAALGPEETKAEQARLLTLLRGLHPVLVVDQICKALAFFGGIPGAPPPAAGGFPESAEANGPGSLFVGWIAEIFPRLGGNPGQQSLDPTRQLDDPQPPKRKRGRPKGSKATRARKDKGVKKGPKAPPTNADRGQPPDVPDESWVDIDDNGGEAADDVDANVMLLTQATPSRAQLGTSDSTMAPVTPAQAINAARTALPGAATASGAATVETSSARKRGRPKGSRNRPKVLTSTSTQTPGATSQAGIPPSQGPEFPSQGQVPQVAQVTQTSQLTPDPAGPQSFTAVNSLSPAPPKKRAGRPREPGSKQQGHGQNNQPPAPEPDGATGTPGTVNSARPPQAQVPAYPAPQTTQVPQVQNLTLPTPPTAGFTQSSGNAGQKRKRKGNKDADASQPRLEDGGNDSAFVPDANGHAVPAASLSNARPPPSAAAADHPPKRQRKGKEARGSARKGNEAAAKAIPSEPVPNPSPGLAPSAATPHKPEPPRVPASVGEHAMHPPQQGHFEVQSPTVENFEAQLQAQFDQDTEIEPQTLASQNATGSTQLMANRPPQHQRRYSQQHPQQQHQQNDSVKHGRSPNLQPHASRSQAASSPLVPQPQARTSQSHYNQYRASSSPFQQQQQQQQQQKQQQQNYVSSQTEQPQQHPQPQPQQQQQQQQQQQRQYTGGQQHSQNAQVTSAQQYSGSAPQQQQYTSNQQPYTASQPQYAAGQPNLTTQQRYQHQLATTSSAGTASYTAHQSPQFGPSTSNTFNAADGSYRSQATALSNPSYSQQSQAAATSFRSASPHGLPHHSSAFGTGTTSLQQRSSSTSQPTSQSMQGLANVQAFTGNAAADWGLFDTSHLDTSGQQGAMGLSNPSYGIGAAGGRASSNTGSAFAATGLGTFDTSGLGSGERYYGVGRR